MSEFDIARLSMVEYQIAARGLDTPSVLAAMRRVPRHEFVPDGLREFAYSDSPLPIGEHQTISQPYVVALMTDAAALEPGDRVLEIGTGSGYGAAVLAQIAAHVDTIERIPSLAAHARAVIERLGYTNIDVHLADGTLGLPDKAPFDAIIATAGGPDIPDVWREQLVIGGRLVMPIGPERERQRLVRLTRRTGTGDTLDDLCGVQFVPLIGANGWQV